MPDIYGWCAVDTKMPCVPFKAVHVAELVLYRTKKLITQKARLIVHDTMNSRAFTNLLESSTFLKQAIQARAAFLL